MDVLKKLFPLSFKYTKDVPNLIIGIIIYLIVGVLMAALIVLSTMIGGWIPVVGPILAWALGVVGSLIDIYVIAGIVIQILVFAKVIS